MNKVNIEIKWAIIFMLATLAWMVVEKLTGLHDQYIVYHAIYTNIFAVIAVSVYVLAMRDKRKNFYKGQMSYRQGIKFGLLMTLFIVLLVPFSQYITHTFITPDYFANVSAYAISMEKLTAAEAADYYNLQNYSLISMLMGAVMGIVTTLVVAIFTRSKI